MRKKRRTRPLLSVMVELRVPLKDFPAERTLRPALALEVARRLKVPSFEVDPTYSPVPLRPPADLADRLEAAGERLVVVRGMIPQRRISQLEALPGVVRVWRDTRIAPFGSSGEPTSVVQLVPASSFGACPIAPCDCDSDVAKGTLPEVARYLGADQIWAANYTGEGIVIGIVDGGINAIGRAAGGVIPRVVGGWPDDWGTRADWGGHGNMTATDALGMAADANLYDIRITPDSIAGALNGFDWAIDEHRMTGMPHILSNSWGIFQESWDPDYATNPMHPFTRKVVEALDEGILVLFAAGNCGERCPDQRCGADAGPGRSIWGANGHPRVITVGAANIQENLIGYSSQGPAALSANKPDFLAPSHFQGYFAVDSGTSAACPVTAGVVALLKGVCPGLTQDLAKEAIMGTAKDLGPSGWDQHSGAGILQAGAAFDLVFASMVCT